MMTDEISTTRLKKNSIYSYYILRDMSLTKFVFMRINLL